MYGEVGRVGVGVLNVMTDSNADQPILNDTVARVRYTTPDGSALGAILSTRNSLTDDPKTQHQHSAGLDGAIRFLDRRLELGGFTAFTVDQEKKNEIGDSQQVYLEYRGRHVQPKVRALRVSETFSPNIGFVRRRDVIQPSLELPLILRFKESPIANIVWTASGGYTVDGTHDEYLGFESTLSGRLQFSNGLGDRYRATYLSDVVQDGFDFYRPASELNRAREGPQYNIFFRTPSIKNPSAQSLSYTSPRLLWRRLTQFRC